MQFMLNEGDRSHINRGEPLGNLKRAIEKRIIAFRGEAIALNNPRNHPPYYENVVRDIMTGRNYWPVVLATHNSHAAGFPALEEARYIRDLSGDERIKGSRLVIAANIRAGQNEEIQEYFKVAEKVINKLDTQFMFVVRDKDVANGETRNREKQHEGFMSLIEDGRIPVILPEGSVESGRQKVGGEPGEVKGMIPLARGSIRLIVRYIRHQGMEPLLFFVGTTGANHIYNPITEKVTNEVKLKTLGLIRRPLMSSVIDYPVRSDLLEQHLQIDGKIPDGAWEQYVGERLAQLIPQNERGVYTEPTLLSRVPLLRRDTTHLFQR